jgi:predicted metal-dependent HD superfamily phosphohydrolase
VTTPPLPPDDDDTAPDTTGAAAQPVSPPTEAATPANKAASALPPDQPTSSPDADSEPETQAQLDSGTTSDTPVTLPAPPPTTDAIGKPLPSALPMVGAAGETAEKGKKHKKGKKGKPEKVKAAPEKEKLPPLSTLVEVACAYVERLFAAKLPSKMVFHDLKHTQLVVKAARRLANDQQLSATDTEALLLAAYFHDTGYTQRYVGHEAVSADLAAAFLRDQNYPPEGIERVKDMILATEFESDSRGPLADLLVDADMSGMGREEFAAAGERLRLEWEMYLVDRSFSTPDWVQYQLDYLNDHNFRTAAARARYGPGRQENIEVQEKLIQKLRKKEKKKEKDSRDTLAQPKRGIETMFHNIYSTHTSLSGMADQKANMMIQLNTLLISALITYLAARSTTSGIAMLQNPIVAVPGGLLLATALGSVVTAILSAQPEITSFRLNSKVKPTANRRINLLFFGNFVKLPLEEFQEGMRDLMRQKDALYMNMTTDIYYLGDVLNKKYRLLKISYTVFMVGIILVVFSFVISILYKGHL